MSYKWRHIHGTALMPFTECVRWKGQVVPPSSSFDPLDLGSDLLLWLRADDTDTVLVGGARQYTAANSESHSAASFAAANLSTTDAALIVNVYRDSAGAQVICSKYQDADNYWKWEFTAGNVLHFVAVVATVTVYEVTGTTAVTGTGWHQAILHLDRDSTSGTRIYLDNADDTAGTPTVSATSIDNTGVFAVGAMNGAAYWNGGLSGLGGMKSDLLSAAERTWLYNYRNGRIYGELGEAGTDGAGLTNFAFWYNGTEASGNLLDAVATNDLTDNNTVTARNGMSTDNAQDSSANANTGVFNGSPTAWSTDISTALNDGGLCLTLDGTDDYVAIADSTALDLTGGNATWSIWLKPTTVSGTRVILAKHHSAGLAGWGIFLDSGNIYLQLSNGVSWPSGSVLVTWTPTLNVWQHLVVTKSGTSVAFYVDGVQVGTTQTLADGTIVASTKELWIGADVNVPVTSVWSGKIDDVRIYNVAKTAPQALALSQGTDDQTGIVGHWKLDDGAAAPPLPDEPILEWRSKEGNRYQAVQATAALRPTWVESAVNGLAGIRFDGTQYLRFSSNILSTMTDGMIVAVIKLEGVPDSYQTIIATADEAGTTRLWALQRGNTANAHLNIRHNNAGAESLLDGNTTLANSTSYVVEAGSNGTVTTGRVTGVDQTLNADTGTNAGNFPGDVSNADNTILGALQTTSVGSYFTGIICEVLAVNNLTDAKRDNVRAYLTSEYGIDS